MNITSVDWIDAQEFPENVNSVIENYIKKLRLMGETILGWNEWAIITGSNGDLNRIRIYNTYTKIKHELLLTKLFDKHIRLYIKRHFIIAYKEVALLRTSTFISKPSIFYKYGKKDLLANSSPYWEAGKIQNANNEVMAIVNWTDYKVTLISKRGKRLGVDREVVYGHKNSVVKQYRSSGVHLTRSRDESDDRYFLIDTDKSAALRPGEAIAYAYCDKDLKHIWYNEKFIELPILN